MALEKQPQIEEVQNCVEMLQSRKLLDDIDEGLLVDEISTLQKYQKGNELLDLPISTKWTQFFKDKPSTFCPELSKIAYIFFAIPAHNANAERVFSFMNLQWTDLRNRLQPEAVSSILLVQYNLCKRFTCKEFLDYIRKDKEALKQAGSNAKYLI